MTTLYQQVHSLLVKIDGWTHISREQWLENAGVASLKSSLRPSLTAEQFAFELLDVAYQQGGDTGLRKIVGQLRQDYNGHHEVRDGLDAILTTANLAITLFPQGRVAWATAEEAVLHAAITHFNTLPTDHVPDIHTLPSPHVMTLRRNRDFVGREAELMAVARTLKTTQVAAVVAAGIGGVGKTQLAVEWVHRYGHYFKGGVFWLDFSNPENVPLEVASVGTKFAIQGYDGKDLEGKVAAVKAHWAKPMPILLVFDNCEDTSLAQEYIPITGGARVLLTSRDQTWQSTLRSSEVTQIAIETLPRDQSVALLRKFQPDLNPEIANGIAEAVGDLPLALHLAGSYLNAMQGTSLGDPTTYLASLRNPELLRELEGHLEWVEGTTPTYHDWSVAKTFALSIARLGTGNQPDSDLLQLLLLRIAHFAPSIFIPLSWLFHQLPEGKGGPHVKRACNRLLKLGLLEEDAEGMVRMHRLVAQVVLANASLEAKYLAEQTSESIILDIKPTYGDTNFVAQMDIWLPHAQAVIARALIRRDKQAALLAHEIGYLIEELGFYDQALPLYENVLGIYQEVFGSRHPDTVASLNNLAGLHRAQGKYSVALPLYEEALSIGREVRGSRHPDTATSLNNLAGLYRAQGKYEEASLLYEEALEIYREVLDPRDPDMATSLNSLAELYRTQGKYEEALSLYNEALGIRVEILGPRHPSTATSLNNLALLYKWQGKYEESLPLLKESLEIRREVLGVRHPLTATSLNNLALLYELQGKHEEALTLYEEALEISREVLGVRHPSTATSLNNLAGLYESQEKYEEALPLYVEALEIRQEMLGARHPDTAMTLNNLAGLYYHQGFYQKSIAMFDDIISIFVERLGPEHPNTKTVVDNREVVLLALEQENNQ